MLFKANYRTASSNSWVDSCLLQTAIPILIGTKFDDFVRLPPDLQWTIVSQVNPNQSSVSFCLFIKLFSDCWFCVHRQELMHESWRLLCSSRAPFTTSMSIRSSSSSPPSSSTSHGLSSGISPLESQSSTSNFRYIRPDFDVHMIRQNQSDFLFTQWQSTFACVKGMVWKGSTKRFWWRKLFLTFGRHNPRRKQHNCHVQLPCDLVSWKLAYVFFFLLEANPKANDIWWHLVSRVCIDWHYEIELEVFLRYKFAKTIGYIRRSRPSCEVELLSLNEGCGVTTLVIHIWIINLVREIWWGVHPTRQFGLYPTRTRPLRFVLGHL